MVLGENSKPFARRAITDRPYEISEYVPCVFKEWAVEDVSPYDKMAYATDENAGKQPKTCGMYEQ